MTQPARPFDLRDAAVAVAINLLWGLNIIAVKMSMNDTSPLVAGLLRQAVVLLACLPALRLVPGHMGRLLLLSLLNGALFIACVNFSVMVADNVSALAVASQLGVPFALILAVMFLGEKMQWPRILGVVLSFGGVAFMLFDPRIADEGLGLLLTTLGCLIWATGSLLQRGLGGVSVLNMYAWIALSGVVVLTPLCLLLEPESVRALPELPLKALGWIAFSAIASTLCGHGGMAWLLQRHPVSTVTPLTLASPVVAVVASTIFFGTSITAPMILGGILALAGVAIITFATRAAHRKEHDA